MLAFVARSTALAAFLSASEMPFARYKHIPIAIPASTIAEIASARYGNVYVSTGPALPSNGKQVPTITLTVKWLTTFDPKTGDLVHSDGVSA